MFIYDTQDLLESRQRLRVSVHALREAYKEGLRGRDIVYAIFKGRVIERYPDRDRVLILGPVAKSGLPLHVVCDYTNANEIVAVTVYVPDRSVWASDQVRRQH
ncbi:MAG: hypothetical protein DRI48_03295 [Chloroflexi bacterium]|nr:MAG: hypothetical protein DRI48_03295 [Chloroflexota bacterium]